ncbi:MAG: DUF2853 family protein [Crocinitomicaceae bacterium]|nr:DUF2853 family protein [Crocinitomicaceae bacterium]
MGKKDDLIAKYHAEMDELNINYDAKLFEKVVTGCGPSIYNADAATVSGSDPSELTTVKNNFLIRKLGLDESHDLDGAIASTINILGKSNRNKYRAIFYYLLMVHFKKESVYA